MERKIIAQLPQFPPSKIYQPTKAILNQLDRKLEADKSIDTKKKQSYLNSIKQINWAIGKVSPNWPPQVEQIVDNMKSSLQDFDGRVSEMSKGSSLFCGSKGNPKELDQSYRRLIGYTHIFKVIAAYQDKKIKEDIVFAVIDKLDKQKNVKNGSQKETVKEQPIKSEQTISSKKQMCNYCELMNAVSLCPNGYIAKKLVKQLPNTEWIAGILYEQGKIVDKDLNKAILYYEQARKNKNYEALYRLGSLNERGQYGKPYEYLKMWEEAGANGHLEALTDMGYLYENGLEDEQTGRTILEPNYEKALTYYTKASEKNFPRALNNLATFYFNNPKYKDQSKCLQYLEKAADAEYVKSLHNLGLIYYQGNLVAQDDTKAKNLIKRSAEKGDVEGRVMYIEMMLNDTQKCSADDLQEMNRYCRQIIAQDDENAEAYYFLGIMYEEGLGVSKLPKYAILYYTIAASLHNQGALMKLGECYKNGFGIEKDGREAIRRFDEAAKTNKQALVHLGQIYEQGCGDLKPNYEKAFQYYYNACDFNIPEACTHLGNMYKLGRHVAKNDQKAEEYFEKGRQLQKKGIQMKLNSSSSQLIQSSYYRRK